MRALLDGLYHLDLDDAALFSEVGAAWGRAGPQGPMGAFVATFEGDADIHHDERAPVFGAPELLEIWRHIMAAVPESLRAVPEMLRGRSAFFCSTVAPFESLSGAMTVSRTLGVGDFSGFVALGPGSRSLVVGTPLDRAAPTSFAAAPILQSCAAHIGAAWRLRCRLAAPDAFEDRAEAVVQPDGRVVHAEGPARTASLREALRRGVIAREKARLARKSEGEALWPELIAGRWTLIDTFDHAARRFVVAYRNPAEPPLGPTLTERERQVAERVANGQPTKVIAGELEVTEALVSTVLHSALRKLRLATVSDLIRLASACSADAHPDTLLGPDALRVVRLPAPGLADLERLTRAECEILAELLRGASNVEIAMSRNRSARTVANQIASLFEKLEVGSRRELSAKVAALHRERS